MNSCLGCYYQTSRKLEELEFDCQKFCHRVGRNIEEDIEGYWIGQGYDKTYNNNYSNKKTTNRYPRKYWLFNGSARTIMDEWDEVFDD